MTTEGPKSSLRASTGKELRSQVSALAAELREELRCWGKALFFSGDWLRIKQPLWASVPALGDSVRQSSLVNVMNVHRAHTMYWSSGVSHSELLGVGLVSQGMQHLSHTGCNMVNAGPSLVPGQSCLLC